MSQKDMQAIQPPEPSAKEIKGASIVGGSSLQKPEPVKLDLPSLIQKRNDKTKNVPLQEQKKNVPALGGSSLQKPEPVKLDLPSLIQTRTDKTKNMPSQEQKKTVPDTTLKMRSSQRGSAVPDILTCMLKDTTAEHHKHLFDVKCKICTGQMPQDEMEEPAPKKKRVSEDKHESPWRSSRGDDSPLQAPPDSPELDSPVPHFTMGSPVLTIVEPPASPPAQDSPSSPPVDTPASPVMESPASPTSDDTQCAQMKTYTPVVIPAVSTVTITRRDPRTAASRYAALTNSSAAMTETEPQKSDSYFPSSSLSTAPPVSLPSAPILPKSILMKPSHSADPRLYGSSSRNSSPKIPPESGTAQFLSKQDILWKGFLNMLTIAKFVTKGYLVSGSAEPLKADLPDTIQIGGRILPKTVWDYVAKLKTSVTKELCVIRFQPATDEEEVAYVSLFSYFSSRGRFGVVANGNRSIKDMYLFPLSAKETVPDILQPLEGPGFEKNRPNLLLGLAIIQKTKRPGNSSAEVEEKRPKVSLSTDPSWIPKPPSLYGSNKLDDFQPYDPETPITITPPGSPPRSTVSSASSVLLTSVASPSQSKANKESLPAKIDATKSNNETPLQTILKQLFPNKQTESVVSPEASNATKAAISKKFPVSMVDPIVQQYGGKTTIEEIEEDDNDLDRPYDPEEEYDPAGGYGVVPKNNTAIKEDVPEFLEEIDDDVAYDPEDETIFEDIQKDNISKNISDPVQTSKSVSNSVQNPSLETPAPASTPSQITTPATATYTIPTGTVVISAETLTEQQRMLEELNRQIEEQKRQLKEQEEALRQQREAVGMFMAKFSASDSLVSPPSVAPPLNKLVTMQSGVAETVKVSTLDCPVVETTSEKDTSASALLDNKSETQEVPKETEQNSSAGEVGDSDVAYDPEDESLFDEIQAGMLEKKRSNSRDSSVSKKEPSSSHSRRHKYSPKRRSNRERGRHRSSPNRSQRRSPSHSRKRRDRDRHHRSERNSSRHRSRDRSERRRQTQRNSTSHSRSHRHRRSTSSHRNKHSVSLSPHRKQELSPDSRGDAKNETSDDVPQPKIRDEKLLSPSDIINDVNTNEKELPTSMEVQEQSVCTDTLPGDLKRLKWATELMMDGKLDSLIPLRELDPPTRDSPQSPDPEPPLDLMDFIKREIKTDPVMKKCEEKVKIENDSKSLEIPDITVLNDKKQLGLMEGPAVACIKEELKSEETLLSDNIVAKELDDTKSHVVEGPPAQNEGSCEDSSLAFVEPEKDHQTTRHGSTGSEKPDRNKITLDSHRGKASIGQADKDRKERSSSPSTHTHRTEHISSKSIEDNHTLGLKQIHGRQFSKHQIAEENPNANRDNRNRRESENMGSKCGESLRPSLERRDPNVVPGMFLEGQNFSGSQFDVRGGRDFTNPNSRGEGLQRRDSGSFSGSDRGGFEGPDRRGQTSEGSEFFTDHPQPEMRRGDFEDPWNNSGPGFRGRGSRGLPFGGPGSHRGRHGCPPFDRGEEHRDIPMDGPGPCRGGFGGAGLDRGGPMDGPGPFRGGFEGSDIGRSGELKGGQVDGQGSLREGFRELVFGRGRDHRGGPMENPGHHRGALEQADYDRAGPMEGPGPHKSGFGGPGFGRGGEQEEPAFDRESPIDGPGPHRGDFGEQGFSRGGERRGPMDGPGPPRGAFGGPGFGRGGEHKGPLDGPGLYRSRFGGPRGGEQRGGPMEGPEPHRDGFGEPGFDRGGGHRGPMDFPEHQRGRPEELGFDRVGPMDDTGPHRGGFRGPGFGRGGEHRGPMDGLRTHRGGFGGPVFGRGEEHGLPVDDVKHHRGGHEDPDFDKSDPVDGPGPRRGGFGGPGFGRGDPIENPEHQRSGHEEPAFDRGGPMDGPGPQRGGFGGPGFSRGVEHRGQMDGQGLQRGVFRGPVFSRGQEHRGGFRGPSFGRGEAHEESDFDRRGPMDGPGPHRGGFGGPSFGGGGGHRGRSIEGQGPHEGEFGEAEFNRSGENGGASTGGHPLRGFGGPDFDRDGPMDGSGPHRGGFRAPGFGRGGEHRGGPIDGPGPRRECYRGPDFDRGWEYGDGPMKGPGTHRGGPGKTGFGRGYEHGGAPMDGPGPYRGGFEGPGFGRCGPVDGSGPNRGRHGRPAFGDDGENRGAPMDGPGQLRGGFGKPGFDGGSEQRVGPMKCPRPLRGEHEMPGFDREGPDFRGRNEQGGPRQQRGEPWTPGFRREGEQGDFPIEGPSGGPNFRGPGPNSRDPFRDSPLVDDDVRENNRQGSVRNDPAGWDTGPQPLLRGLGPSKDNQRYGRSCLGGPDFRPEGEFCGPGPSFTGLQNECGDPGSRGLGQPDRPFGGPSGDSENGRSMDNFRGPRPDDQRPEGLRPDNERNEENRYRQGDGPDRPHHRRDRRSHERERSRGRDMRDDQRRPPHRRGSLSREHPTRRRDYESGPKSDLPKVDAGDQKPDVHSPNRIDPQIKSPTSGESVSRQSTCVNTSTGPNAQPEEQKQVMPRRLKPALLPTPPEGPLRPSFSPRGRGRGRGGPMR